jgi:mannose-1-phosphate guanylyltransferase
VGLYLESIEKKGHLPKGENINGNVLIELSAKIGKNCIIGPNVTIRPNVIIEDGVRISRAAILERARIKAHNYINSCIVG